MYTRSQLRTHLLCSSSLTSFFFLPFFPLMAAAKQDTRSFSLLLLLFSLGATTIGSGTATVFTLQNNCKYTIWPGTLSGNGGAVLGEGGFALPPDGTIQLPASAGWSGRFWARTGCNFDESGNGNCKTGDCGALKCGGGNGGATPVSLAEFTLANDEKGKDFYDVSLVDGYNVGIGIRPSSSSGTGDCKYAGCVADLNESCPRELQVTDSISSSSSSSSSGSAVVACKSACAAFNTTEYCCTGDHSTPETCSPTQYSKLFKNACPAAYSYAYDDASSTFTCAGTDYLITFCPAGSS